jgi:hypothetical protein
MTAVSGPRRRVGKEIAARLIGACGLPIGLRIWALVARRPIDSLAILTAGVASIVIIINAVFLQSGFRQGTDQSEGLVSKLQKPQEFLKSKGKYLQRKIDSALAGITPVETRPGARGGR